MRSAEQGEVRNSKNGTAAPDLLMRNSPTCITWEYEQKKVMLHHIRQRRIVGLSELEARSVGPYQRRWLPGLGHGGGGGDLK